jgi:hypothetical protein
LEKSKQLHIFEGMDKKILAIIEIPNDGHMESFYCFLHKKPSIEVDADNSYASAPHWVSGKYKWKDIEISFCNFEEITIKEQNKRHQLLLSWHNSYCDVITGKEESYYSSRKKTVFIKTVDVTGVIIDNWSLYGVCVVNLNTNFTFYSKYKNIVLNNMFRRNVLIEKLGNETIEMNFDFKISIDKARLEC